MERYVILGKISNSLCLYNELQNQNIEAKYVYNIFDVLDKDGLIDKSTDNVILYQKVGEIYNVITLQHVVKSYHSDGIEDFDKNDLEQLYNNGTKEMTKRVYKVIDNLNENYTIHSCLVTFGEMPMIVLNELHSIIVS
jgi:hypothetical protein